MGLDNYLVADAARPQLPGRHPADRVPGRRASCSSRSRSPSPCALLLNKAFRFSALVGIAVLLPWAVAPVVTGLYWKFIFNSQFGLMTALVNALGLADGPVKWLESSTSAMAVAVVATAWRTVPLMALLLLGALRTIPEAQYRAARMDGASTGRAFRYITLPAIAPDAHRGRRADHHPGAPVDRHPVHAHRGRPGHVDHGHRLLRLQEHHRPAQLRLLGGGRGGAVPDHPRVLARCCSWPRFREARDPAGRRRGGPVATGPGPLGPTAPPRGCWRGGPAAGATPAAHRSRLRRAAAGGRPARRWARLALVRLAGGADRLDRRSPASSAKAT